MNVTGDILNTKSNTQLFLVGVRVLNMYRKKKGKLISNIKNITFILTHLFQKTPIMHGMS